MSTPYQSQITQSNIIDYMINLLTKLVNNKQNDWHKQLHMQLYSLIVQLTMYIVDLGIPCTFFQNWYGGVACQR
jgi:hypothetical protein